MKARDFSRCPRCNAGTEKSVAFTGGESEFWYNCTKCNTYINTYIPQEHQEAVHRDAHRFTGNFGGYGSGKTLTSREEVYKHIFLTPAGNTLIGANVASQYEQTIKRDIEADIPRDFIYDSSAQKQYLDIINKHRVMFRPFDDPDKLRSYNLSMFVMVEASEIKAASFTQLKSRLRNLAATAPERSEDGEVIYDITPTGVPIPRIKANWGKGIIESNPDSGWIRQEVLMQSSDIQKHGPTVDAYAILADEMDPAISTHITSSEMNHFKPKDFVANLIKNKPAWWVARYVYGSFSYAEGLVYPSAMRYVCDSFDVPRHWRRIIAYDYGLADNSVFLFGAVDESSSLLYIYKEIVTNNKSVAELAEMYHEGAKDIPSGGMICPPIIDPKSAPKRDYDKKSLADHFMDYGIAFKPGYINLDARIYRLNTYLECGKLRIMNNCECLIRELRDYKFKSRANDMINGRDDKPEDKNNHAINPLEWIVMELPANPNNLIAGIYNRHGTRLDEDNFEENMLKPYSMWALTEPQNNSYEREDSAYGIIDYNF